MTISPERVAALPKVLLHDHLDGGLRPATMIELAGQVGHQLPADDADALAGWFFDAASSGTLELYLETFAHTIAVMQTEEGLRRVAREAAVDLAADGVVYAEQRYAPEQHLAAGLTLQQVVDAVQAGFAEGVAEAADAGRQIRIGTLVTAMRHADRGDEIAALALANRENGVVGFDIAGAEVGFPPSRLKSAFKKIRRASFPSTVHAGEADGVASIEEALHVAGASRLGHGVRIVEDLEIPRDDDGRAMLEEVRFGRVAHWVRDHQVPLELCPTSNVQTGAAPSVAEHPVTLLRELGFAVTVNTDNRLQSRTSLSREQQLLVDEAGWTLEHLREVTLTAAWSTFLHFDEQQDLVDQVILPGFAAQADDGHGRHRA